MDVSEAQEFAARWVAAWNAHDLDGVLAHFAEEAEFSSPFAAQVVPGSGGILRGKASIRAYWALGLERIPDLHFEVVDVYTGVDLVVVHYRNHADALVNEVLEFGADGLVVRGGGTYLVADAAGRAGLEADTRRGRRGGAAGRIAQKGYDFGLRRRRALPL